VNARLQAVAWTLVIDRMTVVAADALDAAGVPFLVIKGPAVASALYDDGEYRPYGDVDLLVPLQRWEEALSGLERAGWARPARLWRPTERGFGAEDLIFAAADRPVQLDLHGTFHGVRRPDRAWAVFSRGSRSVRVGDRDLPAPALPVQALIAALHASVNSAGSRSHVDLDRALRRLPAAAWAGAADAAAELDALGAFADGLRLTEAGRRTVAELGLAGHTDASTPLRRPDAPSFELGWYEIRTQPRVVDRIRLAVLKAFPSRAAVRMRLAQSGDDRSPASFYLHRWIRLVTGTPGVLRRSRRRDRS
jgi:hypothetical protein